MPALPDVPQVLRVDLDFILGEDNSAKCRFFCQYAGTAPTNAELNTVAAAIGAAYGAGLNALCTDTTVLETVTVTDLTSATSAVGSAAPGIVGTNPGDQLPADTATLVSGQVGRRYRGGHPRIYLPLGVQGHLLDKQNWTTAYIDAATTDWDAFIVAVKALTWTGATIANIVNVSFFEGFHTFTGPTGRVRNIPTVRVTPLVDVITSFIVRKGIASIRKRLLGLA